MPLSCVRVALPLLLLSRVADQHLWMEHLRADISFRDRAGLAHRIALVARLGPAVPEVHAHPGGSMQGRWLSGLCPVVCRRGFHKQDAC